MNNLTRASVAGALIALPFVALAPIASAGTAPDPNSGSNIEIPNGVADPDDLVDVVGPDRVGVAPNQAEQQAQLADQFGAEPFDLDAQGEVVEYSSDLFDDLWALAEEGSAAQNAPQD
ncbi:hypothetical protein [Mycobacterium decipiens]|nr:hypothetical protein [Mycobacterium decipiens]